MRPLVKRTLSGVLFLVVVVGCLLCRYSYGVLVVFLTAALFVEFVKLVSPNRDKAVCLSSLLAGIATFILAFCHFCFDMPARFVALGLAPLLVAFCLMTLDGRKEHSFDTAPVFGFWYVAFPMISSLFLVFLPDGYTWHLLLGIFCLMWLNDVGAYAFGMSFGQRPDSKKLCPALSPKKSWIGVVGGTAVTFLTAWAVGSTFGSDVLGLVHWFVLAALVSVFGVFGDLFESLIKRHAQVKDAGKAIPGHGGFLDRFDDVLFVLPIVAIYLKALALI